MLSSVEMEKLHRKDPRPRGSTDCVQVQETEKAAKANSKL
jgi:hypothetical protein